MWIWPLYLHINKKSDDDDDHEKRKLLFRIQQKLTCIIQHNKMAAKAKVRLRPLDVFEEFNNFVDVNGSNIDTVLSGNIAHLRHLMNEIV